MSAVRWCVAFAGLGGAVTVAMGAWASHASGGPQVQSWLETGARYGLWHSIALLAVAALAARSGGGRLLALAGLAFGTGIVLFSGSLFLRALTPLEWVAPATPLGGLAFILGWLLVAAHGVAWRPADRA